MINLKMAYIKLYHERKQVFYLLISSSFLVWLDSRGKRRVYSHYIVVKVTFNKINKQINKRSKQLSHFLIVHSRLLDIKKTNSRVYSGGKRPRKQFRLIGASLNPHKVQ